MRPSIRSVLPPVLACALALLTAAAGAAPSAERAPARAGATPPADEARVIVRFKAGVARERALAFQPGVREPALQMARTLSMRRGITLADGPSVDPRTQVLFAYGVSAVALAQQLAADDSVEWVEVDRRQRVAQLPRRVPNDPLYPAGQATPPFAGQWYLRAPNALEVAAIDAEAAWAVTRGAPAIVVAAVDTGVRPGHPDLAGKLLPGYDFIADRATANDGDGRDADPSDPGDWITAAEDASGPFRGCGAADSSWHGTQVAGLIGAATDNGLGVAGAGWTLRVLPVRALGKCGGFVSDIAAGVRWAAGLPVPGVPDNRHPARVINLSLGSANRCDRVYQQAIDDVAAVGAVVVAAAGNEGLAVNQPGNCRGVVTVAGVRHAGTKVGYSSLGPQVTLAAPAGNCVNLTGTCLYPLVTTSNAGTTVPGADVFTGGGDDATLGTSFASPLVAATAGLMLAANPTLRPPSVAALLQGAARPFPPLLDTSIPVCRVPTGFDDTPQLDECHCTVTTCGAGLLDAGAAVAAAAATPAPPPTAVIDLGPALPRPGVPVTLDGSASTVPAGLTVVAYRWAIVGGTAGAAFTSPADAPTVQLVASTAGSVAVRLTVTDSLGRSAETTLTFDVVAGGGGGGGATGPGWIVALLLATLALRRAGRAPQR